MALKGTIYGTTGNDKITAKIEWSAVQNTAENYSQITATLTYSRTNTGYTTGGKWSGSLSIGDNVKSVTSFYIEITKDSNTVAITHTAKVYHAADGTLSVKISATGKIANSSLTSTTIGEAVTLDTIPRASNITNAAAVTLGSACNVRWTPNSSTFRFKLKFSIGDWSYTTGAIHPNKTTAYDYTGCTISLEAAKQITTSNKGTMTVELSTYSDSDCKKQIGSSSKTFAVTVPSNANTQPLVSMDLSVVNGLDGLYIQGRSKVQAKISAEPKLGTEIKSYNMTVGGVKYESPYLSSVLSQAGEITITGNATDKRGISGAITKKITVQPYYIPKLKGVEVYRCTSAGVAASNGEYLMIKATRDYAPVKAGGKQHNFCTIKCQYKEDFATNFSTVTILEENSTGNSVERILHGPFHATQAYTVRIVVKDKVGESQTVTVSIPTEHVFRHKRAGGKGLGLGGYCQKDDLLDVYWNQRVRKDMQVDGMLNIGGAIKADNYGGGYVRTVRRNGTNYFKLQSKWDNCDKDMTDFVGRQTLFIFGEANFRLLYGVIGLRENTTVAWVGVGDVTTEYLSNGQFAVMLPTTTYDYCTLISAEPFEIVE